MPERRTSVKDIVLTADFAALIAAGSVFVLPVGPVPVTFQTLVIALAGLYLGPGPGMSAVALYILAGGIGVPVFAGGKAGLGVLFGPTGGYLAGFVVMAWFCGQAGRQSSLIRAAALALLGLAAAHAAGMAGLCASLGRSPVQAMLIDAAFLPGDLLKTGAALFLHRSFLRRKTV